MTALLGCLGLLMVGAVLVGEAYSFVVAHHLLGTYARELIGGMRWSDTVLPILLMQGLAMAVGVVTVKACIAALPVAMMGSLVGQTGGGGGAGRLMVRMLAGILLIVPGFFLDVAAAVLLLPPVTAIFGGIGQRVAMSLVRRQMSKMFPGGVPGGAMPFPGMMPRGPLAPDARVGRGGKVVDVTAERVDDKG